MNESPFRRLARSALVELADALESGRLEPPYSPLALERFSREGDGGVARDAVLRLAQAGMSPVQIAAALRLVAAERDAARHASERIDLVWTGPECAGSACRDTSVVVRELFLAARRSILISCFAIYQGDRIFKHLAERMDASPELGVRMFVNIARPHLDESSGSELLRKFADAFRREHWPGTRLPEVFYDPRSLSADKGPRACLHAKCVVVDDERAFITSANFTEAAHERNIEAGVLIDDPCLAVSLRTQFESLVSAGLLRRAPDLA